MTGHTLSRGAAAAFCHAAEVHDVEALLNTRQTSVASLIRPELRPDHGPEGLLDHAAQLRQLAICELPKLLRDARIWRPRLLHKRSEGGGNRDVLRRIAPRGHRPLGAQGPLAKAADTSASRRHVRTNLGWNRP